MTRVRLAGLVLGPALLLVTLLFPAPEGMSALAWRAAAAAALVATWWITEALPIPVTSLLPLVLLPVLGVLPAGEVATSYASDAIFLFLGGFLVAIAVERSGLHRRLALAVVRVAGASPSRAVLGFTAAAALLSMWISNTAAALMLLPMAMAAAAALADSLDDARAREQVGPALLLGVAYGCSLGGLATPVGTPPNVVLLGQLPVLYADAPVPSFASWMAAFLPVTALMVPVVWLLLTRVLHPAVGRARAAPLHRETTRTPLDRDELLVAAVFAATALAWITRSGLDLGALVIPGWASLLGPAGALVTDATVAMAAAVLLFALPSSRSARGGLLDWPDASRVPWGVLILFGGGFAVAHAFEATGLSGWIGAQAQGLVGLPTPLVVLVIALSVTHLTELTSNTATATVLVPLAAPAAVALGLHPLTLLLPVTLAASCAFMLPVATPPNAIVFGSGHVRMGQMVRAGLVLNAVTALVVVAVSLWWAPVVLGFDPGSVPGWAGG